MITKEQVRDLTGRMTEIEPKYMLATIAIHQLGDISSDKEDICSVHAEVDNYYVGSWVTGYGFFHVLFPKETTRELTEAEKEDYQSNWYDMVGFPQQLNLFPERLYTIKCTKESADSEVQSLNVGHEVVGQTRSLPVPGKSFGLLKTEKLGYFRTSRVKEHFPEQKKFTTENSTYIYEIIERHGN